MTPNWGRLEGTLALYPCSLLLGTILADRLGLGHWGAWNSCLGMPIARGGHQLHSLVTYW